MPLGHELRHDALGTHLGVAHRQCPRLAEGLYQPTRQHQVAQPQRGKGDLAEGADVEHPPRPVQRGQRRQGRPAVAVLAVVIVLDDPALPALGPGQQRQAPGQAHSDPGGVLVGRRHIGQPALGQLAQPRAIHALFIHRHAPELRPGHREGMPGGTVPWVFHSHAIARSQQQLCTKVDRFLRTTGDHNLFSRAGQAPRAAQVGGDQFTQLRLPCRIAIAQQRRVGVSPETRLQLGPHLERKEIERRHSHTKRLRRTPSG